MDVSTTPLATPRFRTADDDTPARGPNPVYGLVQWLAGLLVPLWWLWLVRPWVLPESETAVRARSSPLATSILRVVRIVLLANFLVGIPVFALWQLWETGRATLPIVSLIGIPVFLLCLVIGSWRRPVLIFFLTGWWLLGMAVMAATFAFRGFPPFDNPPKFDPLTWRTILGAVLRGLVGVVQLQVGVSLIADWLFWRSFPDVPDSLRPFRQGLRTRIAAERGFFRFVGTLFVIGFSLLPLTALLAALPAAAPNEAVLTDTVRPARSRFARLLRRVLAVFAGLVVLTALFAFSIELVSRLPLPEGGQLAALAKKVLGSSALDTVMPEEWVERQPKDLPPGQQWLTARELIQKRDTLREAAGRANLDPLARQSAEADLAAVEKEIEDRKPTSPRLQVMLDPEQSKWLAKPLWTFLPPALVQHWPFVFLVVYATDLLLLLLIGRVPLAYNLRYLWVRKRDTALTALAFTVVVALVVVLLAFVNGMYKLNEGTGVPGNVLVLAEGSTDELFSNLARADAENVERVEVTQDEKGRPLARPLRVARAVLGPDGALTPLPADAPKNTPGAVYLASSESYMVMNQPVPVREGEKPRRRFLQVRAMKSAPIAAAVHNMELYPGGRWFTETAVEAGPGGKTYLQAVLGEGAASTLGEDVGKRRLEAGDTFRLGDMDWVVTGVMKSQGTTFGSEIWTGINNTVVQASGKGNRYTTLVLRMSENTDAAARAAANYLNKEYTQAKLKAFAEPDYYKELTRTNEQFLNWIIILAVVMAVGGVFGVMNTMFASIAARIKEVGVLRILGFKRWQILISFMLESLAIAAVGGAVGCALGYLANGFEASSTLSGGQGGGKSVALKMIVDYQTIAAGMLFTLVMGRLGGLVPALSAMRMEILESLR
jgi:putative ABC transport system permease protein